MRRSTSSGRTARSPGSRRSGSTSTSRRSRSSSSTRSMHEVLQKFFSPHAFRVALPDVWQGFQLNLKLMVTAEILVLILALGIAVVRGFSWRGGGPPPPPAPPPTHPVLRGGAAPPPPSLS